MLGAAAEQLYAMDQYGGVNKEVVPECDADVRSADRPELVASASSDASTSTAAPGCVAAKMKKQRKTVRFAPGPLMEHSDDGHPVHEGRVAMPVRRVPPQYPADFTKASIRELAATDFAQSCPDSLKRLMFKVGLVRHERPDRVFATAAPKCMASTLHVLHLLQSQQQSPHNAA